MTARNGKEVTPESTQLWGGRLCLDFANTVDWSAADQPVSPATEVLRTPDALARWGRRLGLLGDERLLNLDEAELAAAGRLRSALHAIFSAIARGQAPPPTALRALQEDHGAAMAAGALAAGPQDWRMQWSRDDPRRIRFLVALDAVALLGDAQRLPRVKRCPGPDCGWLFLDTSGRRRWCSMQTCGSRVKMRRLYRRRSQKAGEPG
jgi:predicted RNA-binding Zn ribbon-like protein